MLLVTVALQSVDFISNPSFQSPGETPPERASYISTCGCSSLFFHPQYVPKSVLASIKLQKKNTKKKKRTQRGVPVDFSIFFFFLKHYFPKTKLFSQYNRKNNKKKRNSMCIELVNRQKLYFLFPLEELHFVSKFTDNGFYFGIFSV